MPSRNVLKEFAPEETYHIYNRGVEKRDIFCDAQDYGVFIGLLKKYLSGENPNKNNRHKFNVLNKEVELLAYSLMPNHFHLLLYQLSQQGITRFMRRLSTGYVMYFNNKYNRVGSLFQGTYKASHVNKDSYLQHISRYIHLNAEGNYLDWPYSSLSYYRGEKRADWLASDRIMEIFDHDTASYMEFLADYQDSRNELELLKWHLANDPHDDM